MVIQTAKEHQNKLVRVETLIDKHSLSSDEETELKQLVDAIQAYEAIHYPIAQLSDTVVSSIKWNDPVGDVPSDWIEKWTVIGFYTLRVWYSFGYYEASLTHNERDVRSRLDIGEPEDLKAACERAAEVAIKSMTTSLIA
ncbi:hypothetical protein J4N45_11095 [Vibrio sp. SCSIO 43140]|uniref:hypothetical protein n=1 Tax=Vibrio sp. SCSIO 43140 TaxID=2819100 RepID=UPI0020754B22|nr:hypothetical protein [Vibrio sp. SCSIO 43140]USD59077.1 hypothetical protein J4N45_11095 [Vibrio sp. SCSIO 43140]